jgi:hypothetical protein
MGKSFLLLFFKKEALTSFLTAKRKIFSVWDRQPCAVAWPSKEVRHAG